MFVAGGRREKTSKESIVVCFGVLFCFVLVLILYN